MALKLNGCKRWLSSKRYLEENHGISVHFSNIHHNYYSAWKYTTKKDRYVMESKDHPDLWDSKPPKTQSASISRKHKVVENEDDEPSNFSSDNNDDISSEGLYSTSCSKQSRTKQRKKRMTSFELSELIVRKGMKSQTELLAYANEQKLIGKSDIAEFIVNRGPRVVSEVLATAWEMTMLKRNLIDLKRQELKYLKKQLRDNAQAVVMVNGSLAQVRFLNKMALAERPSQPL